MGNLARTARKSTSPKAKFNRGNVFSDQQKLISMNGVTEERFLRVAVGLL